MKTPRRKRRMSRGGLSILALLLVGSGLLRAIDGAGHAFAEAATGGDPGTVMEAPRADRSSFATAARAVFDPDGISELLGELKQREAELERREQAIDKRMAELAQVEAMIAENLQALVAAEQQLESTLALADGAMEGDIDRLTRVYETMKPKQAAALFEQMDPVFASGFLARMSPDAAAGIMAGLSPQAAYGLSVLYAGRHRDVPQD